MSWSVSRGSACTRCGRRAPGAGGTGAALRRAWMIACAGLMVSVAVVHAAEIGASLARTTIGVGGATTLTVVVRGATGSVADPVFVPPPGIEILGSGRFQNFTGGDGHGPVETVFRFELSANATGRYAIGPVSVRVGNEIFRSAVLSLEATAAEARIAGSRGSSGPASLLVDVIPATPLVGEPCVLRVRLVLRVSLAEDPQYTPPATPGFWADQPGPPQAYYADEHGERVLVTETRTRVYPLSTGAATVGAAEATLELTGAERDAQAWSGDRVPRREVTIRSQPLRVRVGELPAGAPAGFAGAVGDLSVTWTADRARTSADVPVTLSLDLRGVGNLPLIHPPALAGSDIEVFASTVEDSFAPAGSNGAGRRRFQWTVLPRRIGGLRLPVPTFAWFDPASRDYRWAKSEAMVIDVGPAVYAGTHEDDEWPMTFAQHPVDPDARTARPWAWSIAGIALGWAAALWRSTSRRRATAGRGQTLEWLRAVGRAKGPDFWRAAEASSAWLAQRGEPVETLRRHILTSRYSGTTPNEGWTRRQLVDRITATLPPMPARGARRAGAAALVAVAIIGCLAFGPRPGDGRARAAAETADQTARAGDPEKARAQWSAVWREGAHPPGLAARLAWAETRVGSPGTAAAWVVRGERAGVRDPSLGWIAGRVREGGGLVGDPAPRWPVRPIEWAAAALLLGALAGPLWPRRAPALAAVILSLAAGAIGPIQQRLDAGIDRGVVKESVVLEGAGLDLQGGQVVRLLEQRAGRARVDAGGGARGWVADSVIDIVRRAP